MQLLARLGIALVAAAIGAILGTILTFAHAEQPPLLLIAGLLVVAAYVLGARLALGDAIATAAAALGPVGALLVLTLAPGDEIVIVADDALGTAWAIGVPVAALAAVICPLPRRTGEASESS
ncbi:MAG: hypothetical protein DI534_11625 [Leifsonia xyli]|nr:MAG: hypothetical protein DI534_11625 [Leifsonia xyli]